jgi:hypothetical protein
MYLACRHIKPNGLRCKSPALRNQVFCYFHSQLHSAKKVSVMDNLELPLPEDPAAIQISIARISQALLCGNIDGKRAGQLLYGLQLAAQTIKLGRDDPESIGSIAVGDGGEELAPEQRICNGLDNCKECPYAATCTNTLQRYLNLHADDDEDEDDD